MNCVDNRRHVQCMGRPATEDAPLCTVSVHDIRLELTQLLLDGSVADPITPGMDGTAQLGNHVNRQAYRPALLQQITFRSQCWPGYQKHIVFVSLDQLEATQECVLLGPADDHSSYDVSDSHVGSPLRERGDAW